MLEKETIAAISTGMASSGIGIVRISGKDTVNIISKIFVPEKNKDMRKKLSHCGKSPR